MQDKIQEIMGLVDALSVECVSFGIGHVACSEEDRALLGEDVKKARALLESKLRELVREPLEGDDLSDVIMSFDGYITGDVAEFVEHVERAHGITSVSGEV